MTRVSAINWHKDGWIETESALVIDGDGEVELSLFLPEDPRQADRKAVAAWDGERCHRHQVTRGEITRMGTFRLDGAPLRLHFFSAVRENKPTDVRRLGAILILKSEEKPVLDLRFDPAGPGRTFLPHPDRALTTEFMNIPRYLEGFPPRDAPSDPVLHYLTLGWATGRDPAAGFSSADYVAANPELARTGVSPFVHFLQAALGPDGAADPTLRDPRTLRALAARLRGEQVEAEAPAEGTATGDAPEPVADPAPTILGAAIVSLATGNRDEAFRLARAALRDPRHAAAAAALLPKIIGTTESWERIAEAMAARFDPRYYAAHHAHALRGDMAPDQHYLLKGWQKGMRPSPFLDPVEYAAQLPGGLPAGAFPLAHFHALGSEAGLRGVADGTASWPVPDLPLPDLPAEPQEAVAVVHVILDDGPGDPCPTLRALLGARGEAGYDVCVTEVGDGTAQGWRGELEEMAEAGHIALRRAEGTTASATVAALTTREPGHAAVVLARDAQVFAGWFDRLLAHGLASPEEDAVPVATVTALSTHADFAAYPRGDMTNLVATEMAAAEIDTLAATRLAGRSCAVPGAGGACVLITAAALDALRLDATSTDPVAALGRIAGDAGWRNLVACDVFVPRTGPLVPVMPPLDTTAAGLAQLAADDPLWAETMMRHRRAQPLRSARRMLDLGRLGRAAAGNTVHLSHRMGGGIETYLQAARRDDPGAVVLRMHDAHRMTVETSVRRGPFVPNLADIDLRTERHLLSDCLAAIDPDRIVLHSLSGLSWPMQAQVLGDLTRQSPPLDFIGHDYAAISAQYCLLPPDGTPWNGPPDMATLREWAAMADPLAELGAGDPGERQAAYDAFFAVAAELQVPSGAAAAIFRQHFPARDFVVVPHSVHLPPTQPLATLPPDGRLKIAVLGKIWPHKGSRVVEALALMCRKRKLPFDITLVGHSDIDERLARVGVRATGPYRQESEAMGHLVRLAPDVLFVPSIWPETFCYTLSFAQALGLRPVVFDLGAQAERARAMPGGVVLPLALASRPEALVEAFAALARPKVLAATVA